ncbi:MAG TPA: hypothetical protein VF933_28705 [Streptosporangiaceae bacterium]
MGTCGQVRAAVEQITACVLRLYTLNARRYDLVSGLPPGRQVESVQV